MVHRTPNRVERAYSLLTVKSFDIEARTVEGVATTPTPDRLGDIIEPLGATFANPLTLLLFHDSRAPVGTVTLDKPTAKGIRFMASLPLIAEPGRLRDRVEEAWQSLKAKLIRGVSIGFRVLEDGLEFLDTGGLKFTKTEILELSLVAIPANAEAVIDNVKSIDAPYLAAATGQRAASTLPGATGTTVRRSTGMKTISEQLQGFVQTRNASFQRMNDLMTAAGEKGETLSEEASVEYDRLETEIAGLDKHIARLKALEQTNVQSATTAQGGTVQSGSESRGSVVPFSQQQNGHQVYVRQVLPPGIEFARMLICKLVAFQNQYNVSPLQVAKARYPDNHRIMQYFERAAVPPATTTDPSWAGALVDPTNLTSEFLEYLRPSTIIGKFGTGNIPSLRALPFNVRVGGQTSGGQGYWVGQGKPKPLTKFDFNAQTLTWAKVAAISVITEETARFSSPSAEALVRDGLRDALVERLDIDFIDPDKAAQANVSPASVTNGVTPLVSAGNDADAIRADILALIGAYVGTNQDVGGLVLILPNTMALSLSLMRNSLGNSEFPGITLNGGTLEGIPVITSQYAAQEGNLVIAVNARSVGLADDGQVTIEASREASLEMDSAPTGSSAPPIGASLVSMWQTNSIALRAERFINWGKLRTGAVQYMANVGWGGVGSP